MRFWNRTWKDKISVHYPFVGLDIFYCSHYLKKSWSLSNFYQSTEKLRMILWKRKIVTCHSTFHVKFRWRFCSQLTQSRVIPLKTDFGLQVLSHRKEEKMPRYKITTDTNLDEYFSSDKRTQNEKYFGDTNVPSAGYYNIPKDWGFAYDFLIETIIYSP